MLGTDCQTDCLVRWRLSDTSVPTLVVFAILFSGEGLPRVMCPLFLSQLLLGMYRCTDVPGEFVWQPGTLTQAVTKGHWILLEDIDYAPLDVVSGFMFAVRSWS